MSDCADMTTALARELTAGIKNGVEDLSAVFKKMAILKPVLEQVATEAVKDNTVFTDDTTVADIVVTEMDQWSISRDMPTIAAFSPARSVHIIDDTAEVAAFTTEAPAPPSGLLSFVTHTKPSIASGRSIVFADDISLDILLEEAA